MLTTLSRAQEERCPIANVRRVITYDAEGNPCATEWQLLPVGQEAGELVSSIIRITIILPDDGRSEERIIAAIAGLFNR